MPARRTESVERAMSILLAFSHARAQMSLAELAAETGLHKSTILRLARSMALFGFLDRDAQGRFSIGASVWHLGLIFRQRFDTGERSGRCCANLCDRPARPPRSSCVPEMTASASTARTARDWRNTASRKACG